MIAESECESVLIELQVIGLAADKLDAAATIAKTQLVRIPALELEVEKESQKTLADCEKTLDPVVFTSSNGVRATAELLSNDLVKFLNGRVVAVVGHETANTLKEFGRDADIISQTPNGEALAHELSGLKTNRRYILLRGAKAAPELPTILRECGCQVTDIPVYKSRLPAAAGESADVVANLLSRGVCLRALIVTSSAALENLFELFRNREAILQKFLLSEVFVIGPKTEKFARSLGFKSVRYPREITRRALFELVEQVVTDGLHQGGR